MKASAALLVLAMGASAASISPRDASLDNQLKQIMSKTFIGAAQKDLSSNDLSKQEKDALKSTLEQCTIGPISFFGTLPGVRGTVGLQFQCNQNPDYPQPSYDIEREPEKFTKTMLERLDFELKNDTTSKQIDSSRINDIKRHLLNNFPKCELDKNGADDGASLWKITCTEFPIEKELGGEYKYIEQQPSKPSKESGEPSQQNPGSPVQGSSPARDQKKPFYFGSDNFDCPPGLFRTEACLGTNLWCGSMKIRNGEGFQSADDCVKARQNKPDGPIIIHGLHENQRTKDEESVQKTADRLCFEDACKAPLLGCVFNERRFNKETNIRLRIKWIEECLKKTHQLA